jgi:hypothetical protein
MDFMAALRPQAQTTNQTLRVLGTYRKDHEVLGTLGLRVPAGATTGFHPDVKD